MFEFSMILSKIVEISRRQPSTERLLLDYQSPMLVFFLNDYCGITIKAKVHHTGIGALLGQLNLNILPGGYA